MEDRPRPCSCFPTGYCYRSLCIGKASRWNKPEKEYVAPKPRRQILAWRYTDTVEEDNGHK